MKKFYALVSDISAGPNVPIDLIEIAADNIEQAAASALEQITSAAPTESWEEQNSILVKGHPVGATWIDNEALIQVCCWEAPAQQNAW